MVSMAGMPQRTHRNNSAGEITRMDGEAVPCYENPRTYILALAMILP